jgi:hypothetical protein
MNRGVAARLAWALWTLSMALTALSLLLLVLNTSHLQVPAYSFWAENVLIAVGFSTVGAVIFPRMPPENPIGWLFCAVGLLWAMLHFLGEYATYTLVVAPGSLPAGGVASWLYCWPWVPGLGLLVFLGLLFPNGDLPSARWRWFARLSAISTLVGTVLVAFSPGQIIGLPGISNPFGIESLPNADKPVQVLMFVLMSGMLVSLLMRRLYARGIERQQTRWFTYTAGIATGGAVLQYIVSEPLDLVWLGWVGYALVLIGLVGFPISMGIAVTRYRLYDIDILVNRTLVYGVLTATLALVYFGGVTAAQAIFQAITGQEEQSQLAVVASTLVIAALFTPLRRRIQSFINKRFYRNNYDARKTLEAFSATLREETDLHRLGEGLVAVVGETMQPAHVGLWLRPEAAQKGKRVVGETRDL